ncbi:MAG: hypothetical protein ABI488_22020 [Polyangiaceae bacterium]
MAPNPTSESPLAHVAESTEIDENGVDRNQIRAMLRLTPEQRLTRVQEFVESMLQIWELNAERPVR